jgi:hypothetical protein
LHFGWSTSCGAHGTAIRSTAALRANEYEACRVALADIAYPRGLEADVSLEPGCGAACPARWHQMLWYRYDIPVDGRQLADA